MDQSRLFLSQLQSSSADCPGLAPESTEGEARGWRHRRLLLSLVATHLQPGGFSTPLCIHQMWDNIYGLQICLPEQNQGWNKGPGSWVSWWKASPQVLLRALPDLRSWRNRQGIFSCVSHSFPAKISWKLPKAFPFALLVKGWMEEVQDGRFGGAKGTSGAVSSARRGGRRGECGSSALSKLGAGLFPALAVLQPQPETSRDADARWWRDNSTGRQLSLPAPRGPEILTCGCAIPFPFFHHLRKDCMHP